LLSVVFYQSTSGKAPVLDWLRTMEPADRKVIGLDLLRVQDNWPIGMPVCRSLGSGLWEVRSSLRGGRIARLLFCLKESDVYVLHGFLKTTRKTPKADLDLAYKRMKEVLK
jgi:phage-related protein